jgi:hypothetical protein
MSAEKYLFHQNMRRFGGGVRGSQCRQFPESSALCGHGGSCHSDLKVSSTHLGNAVSAHAAAGGWVGAQGGSIHLTFWLGAIQQIIRKAIPLNYEMAFC